MDSSVAVIDREWVALWWPLLLVWSVTVVSLVAAVAIAVMHWRRYRAPVAVRQQGISFYIDDTSVMDLYLQYGDRYKGALRQEVEERISSNRELKLSVDLAPVEGSGKRGVNREVFRRYIERAEPITVIATIIDVLDRAGDIVDVNLRKQEVTANRALDRALDTDDDEQPTDVRLRGLDTFVSIRGRFRATGRTSAVTTFEAPYGDPTDPADGPQVRVTCAASGLRADVPTGSFPARCLGRVEDWDPDTRRVIVRPIAIFN